MLRLLRTSLKKERAPGATLDSLGVGGTGTIRTLGGERLFRRRLMELGLLPGTSVRVLRLTDLGGLLEIEVRGSTLSLRLEDARRIEVEAAR